MPGQSVCLQCGSALTADAAQTDVHPPRMGKWKKPFRSFRRNFRACRLVQAGNRRTRMPSWAKKVSQVGFFGVVLSIVPGLAHVIQRRFREVLLYVIVWFLLLFGSLFFYGGALGWPLFGLTIGVHAWIAVHSGPLKAVTELRYRMLILLLVGVGLFLVYRATANLVFRDIAGGYTSVAIRYHNIEERDFLLARRSLATREDLRRGSMVITGIESIGGRYFNTGGHRQVVAQIIALPGESLRIEEGVFVVDDNFLDPNECPVPQWLKNRSLSVTIGQDSYFVSAQFQGQGYNDSHVAEVCVVPIGEIEAKAFIRWAPLIRRGFIRDIE